MAQLDPNGSPIDLGAGVTISTPGLQGNAERMFGVIGARSAAATAPAFDTMLAEQSVVTLQTIEIDGASEVPGAAPIGARATRYGEDAMVLNVPAAAPGWAQVVFMQDESGVITWNFAESAAAPAVRDPATQTFVLRRYVPKPSPGDVQSRGLIRAIGTRVIKLLSFPIQQVAGEIGVSVAQQWEYAHRPYSVRAVDPSTYASDGAGKTLTPEDWRALGDGPILLLVHGTFSRCSSTFGRIDPQIFKQLYDSYQGRVVAFDHPTMTATPRANVEWLLAQIAPDMNIVVHALTHSRGGLVARTLAEKLPELPPSAEIGVPTVVLVGAPDNGTALADATHMSDFIETYTNLINFFPDSAPLDLFGCVVAAIQEIAAGTLDHLVGLQSMCPSGPFQQWLNTGQKCADARYYAVAANYAPAQAGLQEWAAQRLMGAVFDGTENDLVVPTAGVYDRNGSQRFPIKADALLLFDQGQGVNHCSYFGRPELHAKLVTWLAGA